MDKPKKALKVDDIKTLEDAQHYVHACLNDLISGTATREQVFGYIGGYTMKVINLVALENTTALNDLRKELVFTYSEGIDPIVAKRRIKELKVLINPKPLPEGVADMVLSGGTKVKGKLTNATPKKHG